MLSCRYLPIGSEQALAWR